MELKHDEQRSGIYCIKNLINGKIYIGKSKNLYRRKYQHFGELKHNKHNNKYLQASVNKYGIDNFKFEVIQFCDIEELSKLEYYWVNKYSSYIRDIGYNIELLDEQGNTIRSYESIIQMKLTIKNNKDKYIPKKGKDNPTSKEVHQYSLMGDYIGSFGSCHEASEILGNIKMFTTISKVARTEKGSSLNYQWRYYKVNKIEEYSNKNKEQLIENNIKLSKPIIALNLKTNEEIEFNSISEASKTLGLTLSCIARIAKGERKSSKKLNMTFFYKPIVD